jgi:ribosomal protein S6--L-glutamate ligase
MRAASVPVAGKTVFIAPRSFQDLSVCHLGGNQATLRTEPAGQTADAPDVLLVRTMPMGSLEQVIFRMNALHIGQAAGLRVINSPRCLEIAIDKWLTLDIACRAGLLIPRTICCQTRESGLQAWEQLGGDAVVKPIFGGEGRGIVRVSDRDMAWRVFSTLEQIQAVAYVQEYLESDGYDLRLLVLGEEVLCVRRENASDWRTNVGRGGHAMPHEPSFEQVDMAYKIARTVGGWMIGVDLLTTRDGRDVLLEVNAVPGWRATAAALEVDVAHLALTRIVQTQGDVQ